MRALGGALYVICTAAACAGGDDPAVGGLDATVPTARLAVDLSIAEEEAWEVATARIGISELRANNDRGGDLEPRMENVGAAELVEGTSIDFGVVAPATYGRVTMRMEAGDWGPGVELRVSSAGGSVHISARDAVDVDARCETPTLVAPGSAGTLELELDVESLWVALPEHPTGGGELALDADERSEVGAALRDAWRLDCDAEEAEGHAEALEDE